MLRSPDPFHSPEKLASYLVALQPPLLGSKTLAQNRHISPYLCTINSYLSKRTAHKSILVLTLTLASTTQLPRYREAHHASHPVYRTTCVDPRCNGCV